MEIRSFLVPTAAALSVCTTTACGPAVSGDWDLAKIATETETYDFPYTYTGTYNDQPIEVVFSIAMTIEKDLTGVVTSTYSYASGGGEPQVQATPYDVTATKVSGKEYTIKSAEADGIDLSCTVDGKTMECDAAGDTPTTWTWEKA